MGYHETSSSRQQAIASSTSIAHLRHAVNSEEVMCWNEGTSVGQSC